LVLILAVLSIPVLFFSIKIGYNDDDTAPYQQEGVENEAGRRGDGGFHD